MKNYLPLLISLIAALGVAAALSVYVLYPTEGVGKIIESGEESNLPTIRIEKLGLVAHVEEVGRTTEGAMANPSNFYDVAWFKEGPLPGKEGSAVIAGHVDNALGHAGVFKNLGNLSPGDIVSYNSLEAGVATFKVVRVETYEYQRVPLNEVFERDDGQYLNLVTCAGRWLSERKTYSHRLVVYTERI